MDKNNLHPLTQKSIRATADSHGYVTCGCMMDIRIAWFLCQYHQGYEDAAQAQQERLDEAVEVLREVFDEVPDKSAAKDRIYSLLTRMERGEQPKKCPCKTPNHELPWCDRNPEFLQRDVDDANRGLTARIDGGEKPNGS